MNESEVVITYTESLDDFISQCGEYVQLEKEYNHRKTRLAQHIGKLREGGMSLQEACNHYRKYGFNEQET